MTETLYKRTLIKRMSQRLNDIMNYPINRKQRITLFLSDMKAVFDIPDNPDKAYERVNQAVMDLYNLAEMAREDVS